MRTYAMIALAALLGWIGMPQLQAQSFYWFGNQQIALQTASTRAAVFLTVQMDALPGASQPLVESVVMQNDLRGAYVKLTSPWTGSLTELAAYLGLAPNQVSSITFGYTFGSSAEDYLFPTEKIALYTEQAGQSDDPELLQTIQQLGLTVLTDDGQRMVLRSNDANTTLAKSNTLRDMPQVRWAEPSFFAPINPTNDPLYPDQYFLNNTGQLIDGVAGAVDADIDAPEAWAITTGSNTIKVAVIDQGVENHPDLNDAGGVTRVLGGYPADGFGGGRPVASSHNHGQACAGIIAASHNNSIGVRGVAPGVKILPVNLWNTTLSTTDVANCFNWARLNGADVISNSWGYNSCTFVSNDIVQAITDARTLGRGGLGCVVVFSAGNGGSGCVKFPGNVSGVMSVAALLKTGGLSTYSSNGPGLGVSAFGGGVPGDIRTTDRVGAAGYSSGDYTNTFNGTSAACPQVSGVAALILSVAPGWTEADVRCRIREAATDIGVTLGPDNDFGAGRLNAYYAVAIHNLDMIDASVAGYQHFAADQHITSGTGCTVQNNARLTLTAGQSVTLNPGFSTATGAYFLGEINTTGPCGSGPRDEDGHLMANWDENPDGWPAQSQSPKAAVVAKTGIERIYPNPFTNQTTIAYSLQESGPVHIVVFDATGKKVAEYAPTGELEPGVHQWTLDGTHLLPGMYVCRLQAGKTIESHKVVLLR